jgi:transposase-like protein
VSEWYDNHIKNKKATIVRTGESFREHDIYCPYCGQDQNDIFERFDVEPSGDWQEGDCHKCGKNYFYKSELAFSTRKGQ